VDIGHGRILSVPYEAKIGWNRGEYNAKRTLTDSKTTKAGTNGKRSPQVSLLDRIVRRRYDKLGVA